MPVRLVEDASFVGILVLMVALVVGIVIKKRRIYAVSETATSMALGFVVGVAIIYGYPPAARYVYFSPSLFFFVLLPPVIFEAGYTLNRKGFFGNIGSILAYAVFGTVNTAIAFGLLIYALGALGLVPLSLPSECFLFGAIMSATDTVATITVLSDKMLASDPLLYSLVFGESVLNDAVAIVLFQSFEAFVTLDFSAGIMFSALGSFFWISIASFVLGFCISLACCLLFRHTDFSRFPEYEFTFILLFAYVSFAAAELSHLSGVISIFFCGVGMAAYNIYNVSENTRISTHEAFSGVAKLCDTFVFIYVGITAGLNIGPNANSIAFSGPLVICTKSVSHFSRAL